MVLTVFGATGMVGKHIVKQALAGEHIVKAFGRNIEALLDADISDSNLQAMKGYVFEEIDVAEALRGSEAVLSALGGSFDGNDKVRSLGIRNIIAQMEKIGLKRIVALGGMGVLNSSNETLLIDTPAYPEQYKAVGKEHLQAYHHLQTSTLNWTFVCAPNIIDANATGKYTVNKNFLPTPNNNQIAAGDLAAFMLAEVTLNQFVNSRVGISN